MHIPVLLDRCVELLAPAFDVPQAVLVDATLGLGGHTETFLTSFPQLHVIGIDRDHEALARARERLKPFGDRVEFVHGVHEDFEALLASTGRTRVNGVLFDLGVSSMQLDETDRGFSYSRTAPLDMRMNQSDPVSAADIVNTYSQADIARIIRVYGEEKFANRIARAVMDARAKAPITTTTQLAELVREAIPQAGKRTGGNPAKRTFQALRIEVNGELTELASAVEAGIAALVVGGRMAVLAYHSLEDRVVKRCFAAKSVDSAPRKLPVIPDDARPSLRLVTRGAEVPSPQEVAANPRAASARLRVVQRLREAA